MEPAGVVLLDHEAVARGRLSAPLAPRLGRLLEGALALVIAELLAACHVRAHGRREEGASLRPGRARRPRLPRRVPQWARRPDHRRTPPGRPRSARLPRLRASPDRRAGLGAAGAPWRQSP